MWVTSEQTEAKSMRRSDKNKQQRYIIVCSRKSRKLQRKEKVYYMAWTLNTFSSHRNISTKYSVNQNHDRSQGKRCNCELGIGRGKI